MWRKQDRLASVILVVLFLTGLLDSYKPQLIEQYLLLYTIIMSLLVIFWLFLDAAEFKQKRPHNWNIIAALLFLPLGIWLHLMQTRGTARGTVRTIIIVTICLFSYLGGFTLGDTLA